MNGLNRYGATLIQDTADFFYLVGAEINQAYAENAHVCSEPKASFYTWLIAHQIERVFGLICEGHKRRQHPNVQIVDQVRNLIDLDTITKATLVVPKIYDDQVLCVELWHDDLVIRYNPPNVFTTLKPTPFQMFPDLKLGGTNNFNI